MRWSDVNRRWGRWIGWSFLMEGRSGEEGSMSVWSKAKEVSAIRL
jgi:hypothetical protein